jgi:hypothetical protein
LGPSGSQRKADALISLLYESLALKWWLGNEEFPPGHGLDGRYLPATKHHFPWLNWIGEYSRERTFPS